MKEIDERYSSQKGIDIPMKQELPESLGSHDSIHSSLTQYYTPDYELTAAMSPFGPLTHEKSRSTFCDLIQCLNISYPDYEFKNVDPAQFAKEKSPQDVMNQINTSLRDAFTAEDRLAMWTLLSSISDLQKCQVYSYHPEDEDDPLGVGNGKIWSWTYFFFNAREKKLILFTCHAKSKHHFDEMSDSDSDYDTVSNPKNVDYYYSNVNKWDTSTRHASFNDDSDDDLIFEDDW